MNADSPGAGTACAWKTLDKCDAVLTAGDSCTVSAGTYAQRIDAANSGSSTTSRITYSCPSRGCIVVPPSGDSLDLRGRSWITVDGFTFQDGQLEPWGTSSTGILLDHVVGRDLDGAPPYAQIYTAGGTDNTLQNFDFSLPPDNTNKPAVANIGANATGQELRTTLRNGVIRGSWNTISLKSCKDCVLDGVFLTGAKNHTLDIGNGGQGLTNLTFQNCVVMPSTGFRENNPQVLGAVSGLTVINSAILAGYLLPSIGHETQLSGTVKLRNNLFFNAGIGGGEIIGQVNNKSAVTWDIDWNGYVYSGNSSITIWRDSRGASTVNYGVSNLAGWQALGFDQHSILIENTDYRTGSSGNASTVWGSNGPFWGAMVECAVDPSNFEAGDQWAESIAVGDTIEYEWDGVPRTVTAITAGTGGGNCAKRITFTPPLPADPVFQRWWFSWGKTTGGVGKTYALQAGSKAIDAGDNASCAHPVKGAKCDLGPVEFGSGTPDTIKPSVPANLAAAAGSGSIGLAWSASTDNIGVTGYNVLRSTVSGSGYASIGSTPALAFTDASGAPGTTYFYVVNAFDAAGNVSANSTQSSAVFPGSVIDTQAPSVPAGLTAATGNNMVTLAWSASTDNTGVTGYQVWRSLTPTGTETQIATPATPGYIDTAVTNGTKYYYTVKAVDAAGNASAKSNQANATPKPPVDTQPPSAPTSLFGQAGNAKANLQWTAATDNVGVTGYNILRSLSSSGGFALIGTSPTVTYTDTTAQNGIKYFYGVKAVDAAGNVSGPSNVASAKPRSTLPLASDSDDGTGSGSLPVEVPADPADTTGSTGVTTASFAPPVPANVSGAATTGSVTLTWDLPEDLSGLAGYIVNRSTAADSTPAMIDQVENPSAGSYVDTTVTDGSTYYYTIQSAAEDGSESPATGLFVATPGETGPPPLSPPGQFIAIAGDAVVVLVWTPEVDPAGSALSYRIYRQEDPAEGFVLMTESAEPVWVDAGARNGTTFLYRVTAVDGAGAESAPTVEAEAAPWGAEAEEEAGESSGSP